MTPHFQLILWTCLALTPLLEAQQPRESESSLDFHVNVESTNIAEFRPEGQERQGDFAE